MTPNERVEAIRQRLTQTFAPQALEIRDDSAKHAGHASAGGGGHFEVSIVAEAFSGKAPLQRHRLVYAAVDDLMKSNEIHALSIRAKGPNG